MSWELLWNRWKMSYWTIRQYLMRQDSVMGMNLLLLLERMHSLVSIVWDISLDSLWYQKICNMVSPADIYLIIILLTSFAVEYHSLRMFHQVQEWKWMADDLVLTDLECHISDDRIYMFHIVGLIGISIITSWGHHISCKTDCSSWCCTCQKHRLNSSPASSKC